MDEVEMKKMALHSLLEQIAAARDNSCAGHSCSDCPNKCTYYFEELKNSQRQ